MLSLRSRLLPRPRALPARLAAAPLSSVGCFAQLAKALVACEEESSRSGKIGLLADYLRPLVQAGDAKQLCASIYLAAGKIAPPFDSIQLGVGKATAVAAAAEALSIPADKLSAATKSIGDLASATEELWQTSTLASQATDTPTAADVLASLHEVAHCSGKQAVTAKRERLASLLASMPSTPAVRMCVRGWTGSSLRIGLAERSVLAALAEASDAAAEDVVDAFVLQPRYESIVSALLAGDRKLQSITAQLGVPVQPMLASPGSLYSEADRIIKTSGAALVEWKYDGERLQLHGWYDDDGSLQLRAFSRQSEDASVRWPAVTELLRPAAEASKLRSFIFDAELVPRGSDGRLLPFQSLPKADKPAIVLFDALMLDDQLLLHEPLLRRRDALRQAIAEDDSVQMAEGTLFHHSQVNDDFPYIVPDLVHTAVAAGCEGVMVKAAGDSSPYRPGKRSTTQWLKLKKDYLLEERTEGGAAFADSLDLVPIAAYVGAGKRTGQYGSFLMAAWDDSTDKFVTVCRLGTGFSDADLADLHKQLPTLPDGPSEQVLLADGYGRPPDVWLQPSTVMEVYAADFTLSPTYSCGLGAVADDRGLSLRFPRFQRLRPDKHATQATSAKRLVAAYLDQPAVAAELDAQKAE